MVKANRKSSKRKIQNPAQKMPAKTPKTSRSTMKHTSKATLTNKGVVAELFIVLSYCFCRLMLINYARIKSLGQVKIILKD